jgi:hypothetical protein
MTPERDEVLGRALRSLDVPAHGPQFYARLVERLERETAEGRPRRRPGLPRPLMLGLAAAAVVLAMVAASTVFTGNGRSPVGPGPAGTRLISATEVRTRVSTALASLRSLSGHVTVECAISVGECAPPTTGGRTTLEWSFVTTSAGDERVTAVGRPDDLSYSAARREQRMISSDGGRIAAQVRTNLPPGPPDLSDRGSVLRRDVASVVRAFLATTSEAPVTEVTEQGRAAWRLVTGVVPNKEAAPGTSADQLEVVVDRQSGFPLRVTETFQGRFLSEVRLSDLVVDGPVDPASFLLDLPAGVQPFRQDSGFRSVTLPQVASLVGYTPVLPAPGALPAGYQRAEVTVAPVEAGGIGNEGMSPPLRNVVSVAYRRGFDRIVVTTRSVTGPACTAAPTNVSCWADPVATGEGFFDQPERYTVAGGALNGAQAELVISPQGVPHVWTIDSRLVVTVAGDASAAELRRLAASFGSAA